MNRKLKFRVIGYGTPMMEVDSLIFNTSVGIVATTKEGEFRLNDKGVHLMQYTGYKDYNGKEIYEGDIVEVVWWFEPKTREQTKQELIINRGGVLKDRWAIINIHDNGIFYTPVFPELDDNHDDDEETNFDEFMAKSSEVIGNIYENPELIEP
jgi:uncharacterized phage protein (TIGR01671 family)